nr:hypothetical protein OG999_03460 [Streptomyces sp. NBC_00886]
MGDSGRGARRVRDPVSPGVRTADVGRGEQSWETLADPEGNEFCVVGSRRR